MPVADLFRSARPAPGWRNVLKTLLQTSIFWGVLLFLIPAAIVRLTEHSTFLALRFPRLPWVAVLLFTVFGLLGLWSGFSMATRGEGTPLPVDGPRRLVIQGPYALVRNPMAVAGLVQGVAVALWLGSGWVLAYVLAGGALWELLVRPLEEQDLERRFGAEYAEYRRRVPCWIPRRRAGRLAL